MGKGGDVEGGIGEWGKKRSNIMYRCRFSIMNVINMYIQNVPIKIWLGKKKKEIGQVSAAIWIDPGEKGWPSYRTLFNLFSTSPNTVSPPNNVRQKLIGILINPITTATELHTLGHGSFPPIWKKPRDKSSQSSSPWLPALALQHCSANVSLKFTVAPDWPLTLVCVCLFVFWS